MNKSDLQSFATLINEHAAMDYIKERIEKRQFERFKTATPDEYEAIKLILINAKAFYNEINSICNDEIMESRDKK